MNNNALTSISNSVVVINNNLIKYCQEMLKNGTSSSSYSPIIAIYQFLNAFLNYEKKKDIEKNGLMESVEKGFNNLPTFYHAQTLRQFVNRFGVEIVNDDRVAELDSNCLILEDEFMNTAERFRNLIGEIPSPFEVVYLIAIGCAAESLPKNEIPKAELLLGNRSVQNKVLSDFCDKFEAKYGADLKKGVKRIEA